MSKSNKVRYKSQGNQFPTITLTGVVRLRERDEDGNEIKTVNEKGDLQIYLSTDSMAYNLNIGNYEAMGLEGYLKAAVWDGRGWKPVSLEEFFPGREYYFGKRERPIDTYNMCLPELLKTKGIVLARTYREHYRIATPGDKGSE